MKDKHVTDIKVQAVILTANRVTLNGVIYTDENLKQLKEYIESNSKVDFNHKTIGEIRNCTQEIDSMLIEVVIKDCGIDLMNEVLNNNKGLKNEK